MWIFFPFLQKNRQFRLISEDFRTNTPACNGPDLGVLRGADDDDLPPPVAGVLHNLMDFGHLHTGGIRHGTAHGHQSVIDFLPLPVGADDDAAARGHLLQAGHAPHPLGRQLGNDMVIVDHRPQHHIGCAALGNLLGQLHRPADPEAKAGRLGQKDLPHPRASISARRSRTARIWSMISSVTAS